MTISQDTLFARLCDELGDFPCTRLIAEGLRLNVDIRRVARNPNSSKRTPVMLAPAFQCDGSDVSAVYPLLEYADEEMMAKFASWPACELELTMLSSKGVLRSLGNKPIGTYKDFCKVPIRFVCKVPQLSYRSFSRNELPLHQLLLEETLRHMWGVFQGTVRPKPLF